MTVSGIAGLVLDRHFVLVHAEFVINISSTRTQPAIEIDNEPNYSGDKFFSHIVQFIIQVFPQDCECMLDFILCGFI